MTIHEICYRFVSHVVSAFTPCYNRAVKQRLSIMLGSLLIWGRHITHQILRSGNVRNTDISLNINKFPALIRNRVNNRWHYNRHWYENLRYKCKVVYWVYGVIFLDCNDSERQVWRCFILYNVNQRQIHRIIFIFIIIFIIIITHFSIMYARRRWNIHGLYKVSQTLIGQCMSRYLSKER